MIIKTTLIGVMLSWKTVQSEW